MYKEENLIKYSFFSKLKIKYVLDHTTGAILRNYFVDYINSRIESKEPFSLILIEIDNFNQIFDNYGFIISDEFLSQFSDRLISFVGDKGLVSRFGADQFAVLYFGQFDYDSIKAVIDDYYNIIGAPLRSKIVLDDISIIPSATCANVSYPNDGKTFGELEIKLNKALYRGRAKGRNCYIIYVDEKHKDIDIRKQYEEKSIDIMKNISLIFEENKEYKNAVQEALNYLIKSLRVSNAVALLDDGLFQASRDLSFDDYGLNMDELDKLFTDDSDIATYYDISLISNLSETLFDLFNNNDVLSLIIAKIKYKGQEYGYVMFCESLVCRLWREKDEAIIYFLSILLGTEKVIG